LRYAADELFAVRRDHVDGVAAGRLDPFPADEQLVVRVHARTLAVTPRDPNPDARMLVRFRRYSAGIDPEFGASGASNVARSGGVAEWFRQGPAKPCTPVRFRSPPRGRSAGRACVRAIPAKRCASPRGAPRRFG